MPPGVAHRRNARRLPLRPRSEKVASRARDALGHGRSGGYRHGVRTKGDHQSGVRNLWRLRRYLRPYRLQFAGLILAALAGTAVGIAVPLVIRRVVDGPIADHDPGGLFALGALALLLGVAEAALIFIRRWSQSSQALGMEATIRQDIYAHLQRLPVAFHDRWQSGQLLARVTADLSVIRRFLSFGLLFLVVNLTTFAVVVGLLIQLHWPLGLLVAASSMPLVVVSRRFTRTYPAHVAADAGRAGRPGDPGRGDGPRPAHGEVVRPAVVHERPVRHRRRPAPRDRGRQGPPARRHVRPVRPGAQPDPGGGAGGRRDRGRRRPAHDRRAGRLRHAAADADLADRVAGLDHRQRAGGDDGLGPDLRGARRATLHHGPGKRAARRARHGRGVLRQRLVQLSRQRRAGAARDLADRQTGRDAGGRRHHRLRQDNAGRPWCRASTT